MTQILPKFLDVHPLKGLDEGTLRQLQNAPVDEFEVKAINLMFNYEADRFYCLLEAPNKQAVEDHHINMALSANGLQK